MENQITAHSITTQDGKTYNAIWHIWHGSIIADLTGRDGQKISITIDQDSPHYIAALCAAQEADRIAQAEAQAEKERIRAERRAARANDPDKQAHGPIPEKSWIGTTLQGAGYVIRFSAANDRVMIEMDSVPTDAARDVLKANGFDYAPSRRAWVRGLSWKAYRAALRVQEAFTAMKDFPCKPRARRRAC